MVIVRPVKISDAHALAALFSQLNNETPFMAMGEQNNATELSENLALFINSSTQVLYVIAQDDNTLLGFAIGITGYISGDHDSASLVIGIVQASIGRGLGRQLLAHVETWARLQKLKQLELTVMITNDNAIGFYRKSGFEQIIAKPQETIDGIAENELYMVKAVNLV